jgi:hypothetical protein
VDRLAGTPSWIQSLAGTLRSGRDKFSNGKSFPSTRTCIYVSSEFVVCFSTSTCFLNPQCYLRARTHGGYVHPNVSVGSFPLSSLPGAPPGTPDVEIRGLRAKGFIKQGNVLFAIPDNLTLHVEKLEQHHLLAPVYAEVPQLHDDIGGLAILLLTEALNRTSSYRAYLCSLPEQVPLPVFYSKRKYTETRQGLHEEQREKFDALVDARRDVIELHYMNLLPALHLRHAHIFDPSVYTYEVTLLPDLPACLRRSEQLSKCMFRVSSCLAATCACTRLQIRI